MKTLLVITLIFLSSCLSIEEKKGYSFEISDYQQVTKNVSDKNFVKNAMGSPSLNLVIDDKNYWIYLSEKRRKLLFLKPKIVDRKIISLVFDNQGIVQELAQYSLSDQTDISFSDKYTEIKGSKENWILDIFGNIGSVRPN